MQKHCENGGGASFHRDRRLARPLAACIDSLFDEIEPFLEGKCGARISLVVDGLPKPISTVLLAGQHLFQLIR